MMRLSRKNKYFFVLFVIMLLMSVLQFVIQDFVFISTASRNMTMRRFELTHFSKNSKFSNEPEFLTQDTVNDVNLVTNGDFSRGLSNWTEFTDPDFGGDQGVAVATINSTVTTQQALHYWKLDAGGNGGAVGVHQEVDIPVHGKTILTIRYSVKLLLQTLEGDGYYGDEFPGYVAVLYYDESNQLRAVESAVYFYGEADNVEDYIVAHDITQDQWTVIQDEFNLTDGGITRIVKFMVGGAGWSYEGLITNVTISVRAESGSDYQGSENLIKNGDFSSQFDHWTTFLDPDLENQSLEVVKINDNSQFSHALHYLRAPPPMPINLGTLGVYQDVNVSLKGHVKLRLSFWIRLIKQNLVAYGTPPGFVIVDYKAEADDLAVSSQFGIDTYILGQDRGIENIKEYTLVPEQWTYLDYTFDLGEWYFFKILQVKIGGDGQLVEGYVSNVVLTIVSGEVISEDELTVMHTIGWAGEDVTMIFSVLTLTVAFFVLNDRKRTRMHRKKQ